MWQDYALMIGGFGFAIALVPAIRAKEKPSWITSLLTSLISILFCICYYTLGLKLALISTSLTGVGWFILLGQSLAKRRNV